MKYAIATFCYGERYYNQVNRLINSFTKNENKPPIIVVTDNVDSIIKDDNVSVFDIREFNPDYSTYSNSYYTFDFSVKRYSLLAALNLGYNKIILTDADAVINEPLFSTENALKGFVNNSIQGQVTYDFTKEIMTNSMLGRRFLEYEKQFNVSYNKYDLKFMPEDCIQFIDIDTEKFYGFLNTWDECVKIKNKENLPNVPAGNIDEMCFSAFINGITVGNNSAKITNLLINIHDKWYSEPSLVEPKVESKPEVINNKKNIIVTSAYELNYIDERGSGVYKGFDLLTETIRSIIFDEYEYIIYTDKFTNDKYDLDRLFNYPNVTLKFRELNSTFYTDKLEPIRLRKNSKGEIYDRIFCVKNYVEVMYNKFEFLLETSKENDANICWVDAGLFGTSCHNNWRDYLKSNIVHDKKFVDKIFEKINEHQFIALKGNHILINYEVKDKIKFSFGESPFIVPGGLFGGNQSKITEYLSGYQEKIMDIINCLGEYTSDQELMCLLLQDKECKFYEFNDWDDLQRGILELMDLYDESIYLTDSCYNNEVNPNVVTSNYDTEESEIEMTYPLSNREILNQILKVSNTKLDKLDLSHNDYMLTKMSSFAQYFHYPSGKEHYRLLSFISKLYNDEMLCDVGTCNGCSSISLSEEPTNIVKTFDVVDYKEPGVIDKINIEFNMKNILDDKSIFSKTRFVMLDTNHDGVFENLFYSALKEINYKGILLLDDIHLNPEMKLFWKSILEEKYDLTSKGHSTGTGVIIFE